MSEELNEEEEYTEETPQPYKGVDQRNRDEPEPEDEETDPEPKIAFNQTHDWQKRYGDLQSHMDKKVNKLVKELSEAKKGRLDVELPATKEEVAAFQEKYPDVYKVVQTVSKIEADDRVQDLQQTIEALEEKREELMVSTAEQELVKAHPDWATLSADDSFTEWLKGQPKSISDGIYNNNTDAPWAIRVVDLYKSDTSTAGEKTMKKKTKAKDKAAAAEVVTLPQGGKELATEDGAKIWTMAEIKGMRPEVYVKYEKEIDKANREGRIQP